MSFYYNTDQIGLFYQQFSNSLYLKKSQKIAYKGSNKIGGKPRVVVMVCTAANFTRLTISLIVKFFLSFSLIPNINPTPLPYHHQNIYWFEKLIIIW